MAKRTRNYAAVTRAAVGTLGALVAEGRRRRGWTAAELAERLGVSPGTVSQVERGAPTVAIGIYFEAAALCGVNLFGVGPRDLAPLERLTRDRLALLPQRVRRATQDVVDDDF